MTLKLANLTWAAALTLTPLTLHALPAPQPEPAPRGGQTGTTPLVKDDLFNGTEIFAKNATDVTEVTMDPDTLDLVGGKDSKRAHSMVLNVVRTYSYDKPGMYRIEDVDTFRNKLNTGDWHCSVHTRSLKTGDSTDVCNRRRTDDLKETAIITVSPKSLTFIHTIRKKGPGEDGWSSYSGLGLMYLAPSAGSLAMLDPEAFIDMQMARARLQTMHIGGIDAQLKAATPWLNGASPNLKGMENSLRGLQHYDLDKPISPLPELPAAPVAPPPPQRP